MSVTEQVQRAIKQLKLPLNLPPETRVPVLLFPRENPELTSRLQEISREGIHGSRVPEEDIILENVSEGDFRVVAELIEILN